LFLLSYIKTIEQGVLNLFQQQTYEGSRTEQYGLLIKQMKALLEGETDFIANLANTSALLNQFLTEINWVGFYILRQKQLVLGPFQGMPACVRIPLGRGVCGSAASEKKTYNVKDVHQFPGHIACDPASKSEIVIPLIKNNELIAVLDIDSPILDRFDEVDQHYLENLVTELVNTLQ
jgi:L-methionine (R)-S-oxide reductase